VTRNLSFDADPEAREPDAVRAPSQLTGRPTRASWARSQVQRWIHACWLDPMQYQDP
jgi:hypothetical protein